MLAGEDIVPFRAGYVAGTAVDRHRRAWRSEAARPVSWAAWYPVDAGDSDGNLQEGPTGGPLFKMPPTLIGAAISRSVSSCPVVLLSHGTGGTALGLSWLGTDLASRGFIAIGVSHHGNTAIEPYLPEGFLCWWERAADLTFILDLLAHEGPLAGAIDASNVFAAGHSLGGYTCLALAGAVTDLRAFREWLSAEGQGFADGPREFPDLSMQVPGLLSASGTFRDSMARHSLSYRDSRLRAALLLAPAPTVRAFTTDSLSSIAIPVTIICGQDDIEAPHAVCGLWLQEQNSRFDVELLPPRSGHYVFLPESTDLGKLEMPELCVDAPSVDRNGIHRHVGDVAGRLFHSALVSS